MTLEIKYSSTGLHHCSLRYFLSAGPGDFAITQGGCTPAFYAVVYDCAVPGQVVGDLKSFQEFTVHEETVPAKPHFFARIKSTNYMLNALVGMACEDRGVN